MPKRHNELESMIRQEPFRYRAEYNADNYIIYEGWSYPGAATSDASWVICKHVWTDGNMTETNWAGSADFDKVWDDKESYFV